MDKKDAKIEELEDRPPVGLHCLTDDNVRLWTGFPSRKAFDLFIELLDADGFLSSILYGGRSDSDSDDDESDSDDDESQ